MYKCIICEYEMKSTDGLGLHLNKKHNINIQTYYETFLYKDGEDKCKICGKQTKFLSINRGYIPTCSFKCACLQGRKTYKIRTGISSPAKLKQTKQNAAKHFEEKYGKGITSPFKSKEVQNKIANIIKEKYDVNNAFLVKNENGTMKREQTSIEKYGYAYPLENPIFLNKVQTNNIREYGTKNNFNKILKTVKEKYKVNNSFLINQEDNLQKRIITCREKYGCDNPSQNAKIHKKQMYSKFVAPNGKCYDSSWEYKFELYLIEHKFNYEYQPDMNFKYIDYIGKERSYIPDFKIITENGEQLIEIKGDHFFDKEGNFFDPYDKTEIGYYNAEQKYNCMINNGIKILKSKDLIELGILV